MESDLKNPVYINYLGEVPINPDDLPEIKYVVGPGTDRPLGFTFSTMHFLYWNVRFFKFSFQGFLPPRDMVGDFLMGGGGLNASVGLANVAVQEAALPEAFSSNGFTTIKTISRIKNRIKDQDIEKISFEDLDNINLAQKPDPSNKIPGDPDGPYAEKVLHFRRNRSNGKVGLDYRPIELNEGSLASAGPIHTGNSQGSGLIIDFSTIFYYKRLYWPIIIAFTPWGSSFISYTQQNEDEYGFKTSFKIGYKGLSSGFANVTFLGGIIPIFYASELQLGQTGLRGTIGPFINGIISYDKLKQEEDCCSRFYYDGSDELRLQQAKDKKCESCELQGVGLKP